MGNIDPNMLVLIVVLIGALLGVITVLVNRGTVDEKAEKIAVKVRELQEDRASMELLERQMERQAELTKDLIQLLGNIVRVADKSNLLPGNVDDLADEVADFIEDVSEPGKPSTPDTGV